MSKLWIFGDSYAELPHEAYREHPDYKAPYQQQLAEMLDVDELEVNGNPGTAASWTYLKVKEKFDEIKPEDYVFIVWTSRGRKWFIKDKPEHANIYLRDLEKIMHRDEADAIKSYIAYLKNDDTDALELNAYSSAVAYSCASNGIAYISSAGFAEDETLMFNPYVEVKGTLGNLCFDEFVSQDMWEKCLGSVGFVDRRLNHMSWHNHDILAKKLYHSFTTRETLDLNEGIVRDIWHTPKDYAKYNDSIVQFWDVRYDAQGRRLQMHDIPNKTNRKFMLADLKRRPKAGLHR